MRLANPINPAIILSVEPSTSSKVRVVRNSPLDIKIRGLDVLIDGKRRGNLQFDQELEAPLAPGSHRLRVTNSLYSKDLEFTLAEGETAEFVAGNKRPSVWGAAWMIVGFAPYRVFLERASTAEGPPRTAESQSKQ